ncbi:MAG: hypothetical protein KGM16_03215 [Bacteroidota bacterium]|nr:hypothetical protein [Bacteroidota bacterium]
MNKIFLTLLIAMIIYSADAQLSNTKWKGTLNVEGGMDVLFNFSNDTLDVQNAADNSSLETMTYTNTDSVLTLVKLYGQSQCDTTAGKYKYVIVNNEMTLSVLSDSCVDRAGAIGTMKLEKEEVSQ